MNSTVNPCKDWRNLVSLFLFMLTPWPAAAFKPKGHEFIERSVYTTLQNDRAANYSGFTGPEVLQQLVTAGFLQDVGTGYPKVLSGYPDLSLERQFYQDQQAYHYMASNQAVLQALKDPRPLTTEQRQQYLLKQAYGECAKLTYFLYREILYNPTGARQAGRGTYVLIHIIGDSFSREHTERNSRYELQTIKGWQLNRLSWPAPDGAGQDWQRNFLHGISGSRDDDWHKPESTSDLSTDGEQARQAILDLLLLLLEARQHPALADTLWLRFVHQHLRPEGWIHDQQNGGYRESLITPPSLPVLYPVNPRGKGNEADVLTIYDFDRSPGKYGGILLQQGIRGAQAAGIFYQFHFSPRNTSSRSKLGSFWKRLPKSVEGSWSGVVRRDREGAWQRAGQLQLVGGTGIAVPLLDQVVLAPRAGIGYAPQNKRRPVQGIGGVELVRSLGSGAFTPRAAIGLEYDSGSIPARWSVYFRIGGNYWNGRMVKATR